MSSRRSSAPPASSIVRPDEVQPPNQRADAGSGVRPDASCVPTIVCGSDSCGSYADDGCGDPLSCGKCLSGLTCQDHVCAKPCTAETDGELCGAAGAQCGTLSTTDRCGKARQVSCGTPCPAGTVCGGNAAKPNLCACNATSCLGSTHCDDATGACATGCSTAAQCPTGGECTNHTCVCPSGGHECGGACVPNDAAHCGTGCLACPTDPHGTAGCDGTACSLTCNSGFKSCNGSCAACPAQGKSFACGAAGTCIALECNAGFSALDGDCLPWHLDTVTSSAADGRLAIAVDASDVSHVGFWASATKEMRWGRRNISGSWTIETLEATGFLSDEQRLSVVVMPGGEPAVLYLDGKGSVKLAERKKNGTSGWTKSTVFTAPTPSEPIAPALAVHTDGTLHAAFGETGDYGEPYTVYWASRTLNGATWTQEPVDSPDVYGLATALALDATGKASLAATEIGLETNLDDAVLFFTRGASTWTAEKIGTGELGYSLSLALSTSGPLVGFARSGEEALVHASKGTVWTLNDVLAGLASDDACLVLDLQGNPHFAYVNTSGQLQHAFLSQGSWVSEQVDTNAAGVAAAIDKTGRLRIVYRSSTNGAVKHAFVGN
ncbi:MAG: hypothetical protein QM765_31550 [Myxococcales bacterium]